MSTVTRCTTVAITDEQVSGIALVGKIVTYADSQWTVHSVEGADWYAHLSEDGTVVADLGLPNLAFVQPHAVLIPMGATLGQGFSEEVRVSAVRRGVCLVKSWV